MFFGADEPASDEMRLFIPFIEKIKVYSILNPVSI
jgi:hypothetical protein